MLKVAGCKELGCFPVCLQADRAATYDPDMPRVRRLLEEAREAHWKLTAPKGFAALKVWAAAAAAQYTVAVSELQLCEVIQYTLQS